MSEYSVNTFGQVKSYKRLSWDDMRSEDKECPVEAFETSDLRSFLDQECVALVNALQTRGACLIRGDSQWVMRSVDQMQVTIDKLATLLEQSYFNYQGGHAIRGAAVEAGTHLYPSTYATHETVIPQHNELSYTNYLPRTAVFVCRKAPHENGQTPLTRNASITSQSGNLAKALKGKVKLRGVACSTRNVEFGALLSQIKTSVPELHHLAFDFQTLFGSDRPEVIESYYRERGISFEWYDVNRDLIMYEVVTNPCIRDSRSGEDVYFSQLHYNGLIPEKIRSSLNQFCGTSMANFLRSFGAHLNDYPVSPDLVAELNSAIEQNTVMFDWNAGDLLLVDNLRTMHGRNSFVGEREILVSLLGGVGRKVLQ